MITGMDWDNDLTPWKAKGVPSGSADFKGLAPQFLSFLKERLIPEIEKELNVSSGVERTLAGVSLSDSLLYGNGWNVTCLKISFLSPDPSGMKVSLTGSKALMCRPRRDGHIFFLEIKRHYRLCRSSGMSASILTKL